MLVVRIDSPTTHLLLVVAYNVPSQCCQVLRFRFLSIVGKPCIFPTQHVVVTLWECVMEEKGRGEVEREVGRCALFIQICLNLKYFYSGPKSSNFD